MALGSPSKGAWTLHGASGAFAGAEDEVYAVLSNSGLSARVFSSQASASKPSPLRKLDVGAGGAAALFAGPSWPALPKCALPFKHALMNLPFAGVFSQASAYKPFPLRKLGVGARWCCSAICWAVLAHSPQVRAAQYTCADFLLFSGQNRVILLPAAAPQWHTCILSLTADN